MEKVFFITAFVCIACFTTYSFTPSTVCIDEAGNTINTPESDAGFSFSSEYKASIPVSQVPVVPDSGALGKNMDNVYSSRYQSSSYTVKEEYINNFNEIGTKPGVHWLAWQQQRVAAHKVIQVPEIIKKVKTTWNSFGVSVKIVEETINSGVQVFDGIRTQFVRSYRKRISDINSYEPSTCTEGYESLPSLMNNPAMKMIVNVTNAEAIYSSENCYATAYVILGDGDNDPWNKPLIVADGIDPRNRIGIQEIMENIPNSLTPAGYKFMSTMQEKGFDIIFVDFSNGGGNIIDNSKHLLRVIEYVCSKSTNVIVGGYSLGGLSARIALLIGEKNDLSFMRNVKKYIAIDSPQLGAQVCLDFQRKLTSIVDNKIDNVQNYLTYENVAAVVYDLRCVAARQVLFTHNDGSAHGDFFKFIQSMGNYPKWMKKIAIADAGWIWPYPCNMIEGTFATKLNGTDIYLRDEDMYPGSYIDLFAGNVQIFNDLADRASAITSQYLGFVPARPQCSINGETRFQPTHIPLYSALGIEKNTFLNIHAPSTQRELDAIARTSSPFDKLYLADFTLRQRHIVFDNNLSNKVLNSLKRTDISAIINMLLSD